MMCAAALCVKGSLAGYPSAETPATAPTAVKVDTLTMLPDGGVVIHTRALTSEQGYAGPTPLDVTIADDGRIADITPLANAETPGFFNRAVALLESYVGKTPEEVVAMKPDAVTGATYSSRALTANVDAASRYYIEKGGAEALDAGSAGSGMPVKMWIALGVALAAFLLPLFVKNRIYHNLQLAANVIVLGFWCGSFIDYTLMIRYLSGGISWPEGVIAVVMLIAAFIMPLFGRPQHYCNHICPLGSAQTLMAQMCGYKIRMSARLVKALDTFRRILWGVLMLLLWADVAVEWMDLELFQAFIPESAAIGVVVAAILFILLSAVVSRPYCRFVCPTGSLIKRAENI